MIDASSRRVGVYGLAMRADEVLLTRIAPGFPSAGLWTLPGGGMEWGESPDDALVREVFEETGLLIEGMQVLTLLTHMSRHDGDDIHVVAVVYRTTVAGTLRPEVGGSTDAAEWHPMIDLPPRVALVDTAVAAAATTVSS